MGKTPATEIPGRQREGQGKEEEDALMRKLPKNTSNPFPLPLSIGSKYI
jgi:hypothetical protein